MMKKYKKKPIVLRAVYNRDMFRMKGHKIKWNKYRDVKTAQEAKANLERKYSFLDFFIEGKEHE